MNDRELNHYEWRSGCMDGPEEPEEDDCTDALHQRLASAYSTLYHTTRDFIKPAPYQLEPGLEPNDELA